MRKRSHRGYYNWNLMNFAYSGIDSLAHDSSVMVLICFEIFELWPMLCSSARPH